ncbi:hypothetical protein EXIGLDRAFT_730676 [Exidia glandulosa HHB12029]|uniref:ATP phosphoribosyltransferase n=1 Tax=Exidia glandulosa HHB12029 TaxID=1314781 RepID=A0A165L7D7_EXIGL|nr:hypothetical protein EXIGLDRAFT_730676 [Exidia glandulosa HHB12029]
MAARFKLVFFCPRANTQTILKSLFDTFPARVGRIGLYEGCAFVTPGVGQFRPLPGANPTIGSVGEVEFVEEDKVEVLVAPAAVGEGVKTVIDKLKTVHPYEEVAFDVYKLEDV